MARFFTRSRSNTLTGPAPQHQHQNEHDHIGYRSLLDPDGDSEMDGPEPLRRPSHLHHRRLRSLPQEAMASRPWLAVAESRPSGERPPPRKLVKEQNGSGRPSFSLELSDSDAEKEKGLVRRQLARLKELYRRTEKTGAV